MAVSHFFMTKLKFTIRKLKIYYFYILELFCFNVGIQEICV